METRQNLATDRWLTTIGAITQTVFWAIGYFFGFTLVTALSIGTLVPGSFDQIGHTALGRWQLFYHRDGKVVIAAEMVAALGWVFIGGMNYLWFWMQW